MFMRTRVPWVLPFTRHLDLLAHDTMRVIGALRSTDPAAPVPGCPDWEAADLLTHLIEMNDVWGWLVANRPSDFTEGYEAATIPEGHRDRLDLLDATNHQLVEALRESGPDQSVCYFGDRAPAARAARLMAVETLVHSRDAEESAGLRATPVQQDVAVDAVDQQLEHLSDDGSAPWRPEAVTLTSTDTGDTWTVMVAAENGDGTLRLTDQARVGASVSAPASVLAPWLFARSHDTTLVIRSGSPGLIHDLHLALGHDIVPVGPPALRRRWWRR
jgi:hypothetical protein